MVLKKPGRTQINLSAIQIKKNVRFDIYLDPKKSNRVIKLRAEELSKDIIANSHALIGKFPGGKAPSPAFSFSSPEALVKKLENWKL